MKLWEILLTIWSCCLPFGGTYIWNFATVIFDGVITILELQSTIISTFEKVVKEAGEIDYALNFQNKGESQM